MFIRNESFVLVILVFDTSLTLEYFKADFRVLNVFQASIYIASIASIYKTLQKLYSLTIDRIQNLPESPKQKGQQFELKVLYA